MKRKEKKNIIPDITEFTDEGGKRWVQTSTDDLFSMRELNDIIHTIETEREKDEVVLARIDFQKVDREFYEAAVELQKRLKNQTGLLKKYVSESNTIIERKNKKLKELIEYIKKLHSLLSYISANPEELEKGIPLQIGRDQPVEEFVSEYEEVEEVEVSLSEDS